MRAYEIYEAFDAPVEYKWQTQTNTGWLGFFQLDEYEYWVSVAVPPGETTWEFNYGYEVGGNDIIPNKNRKSGATRVLATVVAMFEDFLNVMEPESVAFSGSKRHKLGSLYSAMLKRLGHRLERHGYTRAPSDQGERQDHFLFVRRDSLDEAFDSSVDVEIHDNNAEKFSATFNVNDQKYLMYMSSRGEGKLWHLDYAMMDDDGPSFAPTGMQGKDAIKVLSTVVNTLTKFIQTRKPDMVDFEGDKGVGLGRLYSKMASALDSRLKGMGYYVINQDEGDINSFAIVNNDWRPEEEE